MYLGQILIQPYFHAPDVWEWVSVVRSASSDQCVAILARDYDDCTCETRIIEE